MKKLYSLLALFALAGCATGYHEKGFWGGYSEMQLNTNIYRVTFDGNSHTRIQRSDDFVMLRAGELTLQKGFRFFKVMDSKGYANKIRAIDFSVGNTIESGISSGRKTEPTSNLIIKMSQENKNNDYFDAKMVVANFKNHYRI